MTDYTPSTSMVRAYYALEKEDHGIRGAAFDRWLANVKAEAWDEGHAAGWAFGEPKTEADYYKDPSSNPYRNTPNA